MSTKSAMRATYLDFAKSNLVLERHVRLVQSFSFSAADSVAKIIFSYLSLSRFTSLSGFILISPSSFWLCFLLSLKQFSSNDDPHSQKNPPTTAAHVWNRVLNFKSDFFLFLSRPLVIYRVGDIFFFFSNSSSTFFHYDH